MAIDSKQPKMSEIMKQLAWLPLKNPDAAPSTGVAHAALLLAHVAWNRTVGHANPGYMMILQAIEREEPELWLQLRSRDCESMIALICAEKLRLYPNDRRVVLVCGIPKERIHVEWCEEEDFTAASRALEQRIGESDEVRRGMEK